METEPIQTEIKAIKIITIRQRQGEPDDVREERERLEQGNISRENYRKERKLFDDQDVSHIISESLGGANNRENYLEISSSLNRAGGNREDYVFAYIAGLERTRRAVEVSRLTGYEGMSAEGLYKKGREEYLSRHRGAPRKKKEGIVVVKGSA